MRIKYRLIEWLVDTIFRYDMLRRAIFDEVHLYDKIDEVLKDETPGSMFWNDGDGWRSSRYSLEERKYYFNDIPEDNLINAMNYVFDRD